MSELSADAAKNRAFWDGLSDEYQQRHADTLRGAAWGTWQIPEAELQVLGDVRDKDVLELGCGAARFSIALARLGARCVGLDNSKTARREEAQAGVTFTLGYGDWVRLLRSNDLVVDDLVEPRPPAGALTTYGRDLDWSRRWPVECIWVARKS